MTFRECLINVGESVKETLCGDGKRDFWAKILMDQDLPDGIVITDLGFDDEWDYIKNHPKAKVAHLVQLERDGFDFTNDSRGYINDKDVFYSYDTTNADNYPKIAEMIVSRICS